MSVTPIYDWTTTTIDKIYCFSDLEGRIPDLVNESDGNLIGDIESEKKQNTANINRIINILNSKKIIYNDGVTETTQEKEEFDLESNEAIIYTGDIMDRGENWIQLMKRFLRLKEKHNDRVILIGGNRDFNKIRLIDEFWLDFKDKDKNENGEMVVISEADRFPTTIDEVFSKLKNINKPFKYKICALADIYTKAYNEQIPPWGDTGFEIFLNNADRVSKTYGVMMGAGKSLEFYDFKDFFYTDEDIKYAKSLDPTKKQILIAFLNMCMGLEWKSFPSFIKPEINGLYIKYMKQCHFIAAFKYNNKYGIVSHGGVPVKDNKFVIPLSNINDRSNDGNIVAAIENLNTWKDNFIDKFTIDEYVNQDFKLRNSNDFKTMVYMTADSKEVEIDRDIKTNSAYSPAASMVNLGDSGPLQLILKENKNVLKFEKDVKLYYNIFGHQPCGYVPSISQDVIVKDDNPQDITYIHHVCVDISKAESIDYANKKSFAMMIIKPDIDIVTGIFKPWGNDNNPNHSERFEIKGSKIEITHGSNDDQIFIYSLSLIDYINNLTKENVKIYQKANFAISVTKPNIDIICNGYRIPFGDRVGRACYDPKTYSIYFDILPKSPSKSQLGGKITSFSKLTLKELQAQAKKRQVKYSGLNKQELINELRKSRKNK